MKKKILISLAIILAVVIVVAGILFSGVLVMPTSASLEKATPVESFDVLEFQYQRELDILQDYARGTYTPQDPYIIQDPYQANPLSSSRLPNQPVLP
jgi:hypothetical protein